MVTKRPLFRWKAHSKEILGFDILNTSDCILLSHGRDDVIHFWNLENHFKESQGHSAMDPLEFELKPVNSMIVNSLNFCRFAYSDPFLVFPHAFNSNLMDIYNIKSKEFERQGLGLENGSKETGIVMCIQFFRFEKCHDQYIIAGYEDGSVILWSLDVKGTELRFKSHSDTILALKTHSHTLYTCGADCKIVQKALKGPSFEEKYLVLPDAKGLSCLDVHADGSIIAVGAWDGTVRLLLSKDLSCIGMLQLHRSSIQDIKFAKNYSIEREELEEHEDPEISRNHLAVASADGRISIWSI